MDTFRLERRPSAGGCLLAGPPAAEPSTLVEVFTRTCARHGDMVALEEPGSGRSYRYVELDRAAGALAARLATAGIGRGDRVGVQVPGGTAALYVAILGVLRAGAAYVPVEHGESAERAAAVFDEAEVQAVVGAELELEHRRPGRRRPGRPAPSDDAWVIFTSGTTGRPKGVAVTHRSAAAFVEAEAQRWQLRPGERVQGALSVAFDASCEEMWLAWRHGATLVATPRQALLDPEVGEAWIREQRITVVSTVPSVAVLWAAATWHQLRLVVVGGEPCPEVLAERAAGSTELWNTYGPTEATVVTTAGRVGPGPVDLGTPLAGHAVALVDAGGVPVGEGETGEVVIAGVGLGRYLDAALDRERFAPLEALGWRRAYRTGDLARLEGGRLVFAGRRDDQVKLDGRRLELGEIDAALARLPGVRAGAAAVRETPSGSHVLVAYLVVDGAPDLVSARRHLEAHLPVGLRPLLVAVPELPRSTSGKVARSALPWPLEAGTGDLEAGGELASWLAGLVRHELGPVPLGAGSDFFALGGSSLAAARLATAIRRRFPTMSVGTLYAHPVLGDLVAVLDRLPRAVTTAPAAGRRTRRRGVQPAGVLVAMVLVAPQFLVPLLAFNAFVHRPWSVTVPWWQLAALYAGLVSVPGRIVALVALRWAVAGWIRPGRYRRGGAAHLALWFLDRAAEALDVGAIAGTAWATRFARLLGAELAPGARLGTVPPLLALLTLGSEASVEGEVHLRTWEVAGDELVVGRLVVGAGARIGARSVVEPGAVVGAGVEVEPGSAVRGVLPPGGRWQGSPAHLVGTAGEGWPDEPAPRRSPSARRRASLRQAALVLALPIPAVVAALPALWIVLAISRSSPALWTSCLRVVAWSPLLYLLTAVPYAALVAVAVRLLGRGVRPGLHPAASSTGDRLWLAGQLVDGARQLLFPLYGSMLTPWWLRRLGARIGRNTEVSTPVGLPFLLHVGDGSFVADDVVLAPVLSWRGWLRVGAVSVGDRAFLGNSALLEPGSEVGDDALVGVASTAPRRVPSGSSWLGAPPIELPRVREAGPIGRTYAPGWRLKLGRASMEAVRALVPAVAWVALIEGVIAAFDQLVTSGGIGLAVLLAPVPLTLAALGAWLVTAAGKWLVVGRFREGVHPLWSWAVWRTEMVEALHDHVAGVWLRPFAAGTGLANAYLRSMGAEVGRSAWCESWSVTEFDLVHLDADAYVSEDCDLQTHLFHDRMRSTGAVRVGAGATLGPRCVVLPGAAVGAGAVLHPRSLVMRGEELPSGSAWQGVPAVPR